MFNKKSRSPKRLATNQSKRSTSFSGRLLCLLIIFSLLSTSTFAVAPRATVNFANETFQDTRFAFLSSGLSKPILKPFSDKSTEQPAKAQTARISRIQIFPGSVTIQQNQEVILSAVALDSQNAPLSGVTFNWSKTDLGRNLPEQSLLDSIFQAQVSGTFKLSAEAAGKTANATITVIPTNDGNNHPSSLQISSEEQPRQISSRSEPTRKFAESKKSGQLSGSDSNLLPDNGGWGDDNWPSSDDPGNGTGNPPGSPADDGAGSGNFQFAAPVISLPGRGIDLSLNLNYSPYAVAKKRQNMVFSIKQKRSSRKKSLMNHTILRVTSAQLQFKKQTA